MNDQISEGSLILCAQRGDKDALERLSAAYRPLILAAAGRFFVSESAFSRDELIQSGYLGLLLAIDRYAPDAGTALSTYALPWILGEMKRTIRRAVGVAGAYEKRRAIAREETRLQAMLGRSPTVGELAAACGMDALDIAGVISISNPLAASGSDEGGDFLDRIASDEAAAQDRLDLRMALEALEEEERRLILLRYFRDSTQAETARAMGKSQAQISRIERRALDKLRRLLA